MFRTHGMILCGYREPVRSRHNNQEYCIHHAVFMASFFSVLRLAQKPVKSACGFRAKPSCGVICNLLMGMQTNNPEYFRSTRLFLLGRSLYPNRTPSPLCAIMFA